MDYDTQLINLALDAGEIMLASGAETFRVQDTMQRILSVSGKEKIEALAMCTLLMVTLPREEKGPLSMARAVKNRDLNFEKICAVNDMSRAFVSGKKAGYNFGYGPFLLRDKVSRGGGILVVPPEQRYNIDVM